MRLDRHLPETEFDLKVQTQRGYVLSADGIPAGILRYNLFWDSIPFCTMLYVDGEVRRRGYGRRLMEFWENDMRARGFGMLLTSTQADETAQHFYRKLGYEDCGGLVISIPAYRQPTELFLAKEL